METQRKIQKNMTVYNFDTIDVDGKPEVLLMCLKITVGERGFEPPTPWSRTRCSTRLSHSPNLGCNSHALSRSGLVSIGKEARARSSVPEITLDSRVHPSLGRTRIWQSNAFAAYH